jgi:hypothetical protein
MKALALICSCSLLAASSPAAVRINEVLANGVSALGGTFDGVELYNPSDTDAFLTGYGLSDSAINKRKYVFPADAVVPAHGFLTIVLDPATSENSFGLKAGGDTVFLFDGTDNEVDHITFGLQPPDLSIGRVPDGSDNWQLTHPTFGGTNAAVELAPASGLKINEWMANPSGNDEDYFEIFNSNTNPVALAGLVLKDNSAAETIISPLSFIGAGRDGFLAFIADDDVAAGADHVGFKLSAGGDAISISNAVAGVFIDHVKFGAQEAGVSEGLLPDGAPTDPYRRFPKHPTPGAPNFGLITNIVVNELLTHTDPPLEDAVELYNLTDTPVDISGWYLSDEFNDLTRYRIPSGTIVPARGYKVFYEFQFNDDQGSNPTKPFTFNSAHGGSIFLTEPDSNGVLVSYLERSFPAAENGFPFGRLITSDGRTEFTAMACHSFGRDDNLPAGEAGLAAFRTGTGRTNACGPKIGPVVISEIMFQPPDIVTDVATNDNALDEFVELHNVLNQPVPLFDPNALTNHWKLANGISYEFSTNDVMPRRGYLLLVNFDPITNLDQLAAFRTKYDVPTNVPILGPYSGKLANSGETIELFKPDPPQLAPHPDEGFVPYVLVDKVRYRTTAPWPTNAAGTGWSLQRTMVPAVRYGNDPTNWVAEIPRAGRTNTHEIIIAAQPTNQLVLLGSNVTLRVEARGTAPRYQWYRNNRRIRGATRASLTLSRVSSSKAGRYSVRIRNFINSVRSTNATLRVISPVRIRTQPRNRTITEGERATLFVSVRGTRPLAYQWWLNDAPLLNATNYRVAASNAGIYFVTVSNVLSGAVSSNATLTVNPP